jgi:ELWxxDGT repeat protein
MKAVIFFSGLAGLLIFGPPALKSRSHHADVRVIVHEATHDHAQVEAEWNGQDNCRFEAERSFTLSANSLETLRLKAGSGSLEVVGVEGLNEIQAVARACASSQDFLDDLQLTSDVSGGSVVVETIYPDMNGWGGGNRYARLDLLLEVPAGLEADIQDGSGEMTLSNLGSVHVEDGSGEVVIQGIQGDLTIEDGSGELEISGVQGTVMVKDIIPNTGQIRYGSVGPIIVAHSSVYFVVDEGIHGRELWTSDGTNAGTYLLIDLYPGSTESSPRFLGVIGERGTAAETLLFNADDYFHGTELWKVSYGPDLRLSTFKKWKEALFTAEENADPLISGPDGDPDGDGITNLGEYVHGGNPNRVDANPVEILLSRDAQVEVDGVTVTFPWAKGMTDVGYELQISTDLGSWKVVESGVINTVARPLSVQITLRAEPPDIGATEVFVRLRIFEFE